MWLRSFAKGRPDYFAVLSGLGPELVRHSGRNQDCLAFRQHHLLTAESSAERTPRHDDELRKVVRLILGIGIDVHPWLKLIPGATELTVVHEHGGVPAMHLASSRFAEWNDFWPSSRPEMKAEPSKKKRRVRHLAEIPTE